MAVKRTKSNAAKIIGNGLFELRVAVSDREPVSAEYPRRRPRRRRDPPPRKTSKRRDLHQRKLFRPVAASTEYPRPSAEDLHGISTSWPLRRFGLIARTPRNIHVAPRGGAATPRRSHHNENSRSVLRLRAEGPRGITISQVFPRVLPGPRARRRNVSRQVARAAGARIAPRRRRRARERPLRGPPPVAGHGADAPRPEARRRHLRPPRQAHVQGWRVRRGDAAGERDDARLPLFSDVALPGRGAAGVRGLALCCSRGSCVLMFTRF